MSETLFDDAPATAEVRFDWMNAFACQKLGMPEGWRWYRAEVKNHGKPTSFVMITGAVCTAKKTRGKFKGNDDWKKRDASTEAELAIQHKALDAFKLEWQARTGKCCLCQGTGKNMWAWSVRNGTEYRPCPDCDSTGFYALRTVTASAPSLAGNSPAATTVEGVTSAPPGAREEIPAPLFAVEVTAQTIDKAHQS